MHFCVSIKVSEIQHILCYVIDHNLIGPTKRVKLDSTDQARQVPMQAQGITTKNEKWAYGQGRAKSANFDK